MGICPDKSVVIVHLRKTYPAAIVGLFTGSMFVAIEGFENYRQLFEVGLLLIITYFIFYVIGMVLISQWDNYSTRDRQEKRDALRSLLDENRELREDVEKLESELEDKEDEIDELLEEILNELRAEFQNKEEGENLE